MNSSSNFAKLLHNLRNQLNNISMNAELAKMELTDDKNPAHQQNGAAPAIECIDTILDACRKCAALTDQLTLLPVAPDATSSNERETSEH